MRVLVTDGDNRAALAIVRSLGQAGHWVAVGSASVSSLAKASRFCAHRVTYANPVTEERAFIAAAKHAVESLAIDVLIPATDITTVLLAENRWQFPTTCHIPFGDAEVVARAADKVSVLETAMRLGVPVPNTVVVRHKSEASTVSASVSYPVVIKPGRSRVRTPLGWIASSVTYAKSPTDLQAQLAARHDAEFPIALQEVIEGPGVGVFLCYAGGEPIAKFAHRRIREKPPSGGVSVLSESVALCPDTLKYAEALLADIGWEGVAMVEFKRDVRDNQPKLMEINGRFWGSLQLAIDAGVDFPSILVDSLIGRRPATPPSYAVGVRSRWFWGHVDALMIELIGRQPTVRSQGSPMAAVTDFCRFWGRNLRYDNPRWNDVRPWLHETRHWLGIR